MVFAQRPDDSESLNRFPQLLRTCLIRAEMSSALKLDNARNWLGKSVAPPSYPHYYPLFYQRWSSTRSRTTKHSAPSLSTVAQCPMRGGLRRTQKLRAAWRNGANCSTTRPSRSGEPALLAQSGEHYCPRLIVTIRTELDGGHGNRRNPLSEKVNGFCAYRLPHSSTHWASKLNPDR